MTNTAQFQQLLTAGLMLTGWDELEKFDEEYSKFCKVSTSDSAHEDFQEIFGIGKVERKREGAQITYKYPGQGGTNRIIHDSYALGWSSTAEMLADDKYGKIKQIPGELLPSMKDMVEQTAANLLNNGFVTQKTVDGIALFSASHPLLGDAGGTQSNVHASNADLSVTSLQDILIIAETMVNHQGLKRYMKPSQLFIPAQLQWVAKKILQTENEVGTGNNDINTMKGQFSTTVLHYLTSTTAWFLHDPRKNYLRLYWRVKPQMDSTDDFDTKGVKHSIYARWGVGTDHYYGWFGSTGAGA